MIPAYRLNAQNTLYDCLITSWSDEIQCCYLKKERKKMSSIKDSKKQSALEMWNSFKGLVYYYCYY